MYPETFQDCEKAGEEVTGCSSHLASLLPPDCLLIFVLGLEEELLVEEDETLRDSPSCPCVKRQVVNEHTNHSWMRSLCRLRKESGDHLHMR